MGNHREVYVACRLTRSAFSGERVFRVTLPDATEHVGVAPIDYCRTGNRDRVGPNVPAKGDRIEGYVLGMVVENGGGTVSVALPDGNTISVAADQVLPAGDVRHVPVRS